jgi:hypothetical protein
MDFLLAVKRLMKEAAELKDPTDHYHAQPLEVSLPLSSSGSQDYSIRTALELFPLLEYLMMCLFIDLLSSVS